MERLDKFNNIEFKDYYLENVTSKYFDERFICYL